MQCMASASETRGEQCKFDVVVVADANNADTM
jgi:hypothetical protein